MPCAPDAARILVNVPAFEPVHQMPRRTPQGHRGIVGRPRAPTSRFSALATAVVPNPPWMVPQSIIGEPVGRRIRRPKAAARAPGFVWSGSGRDLSVTQQPGPKNALGQATIDMPDPYDIFLHDTPNRQLFARRERALSHGCVRTEGIRDLGAAASGRSARLGPGASDATIGSPVATRVPLARPAPAVIGCFIAEVAPDGRLLRHPHISRQGCRDPRRA